MPSNATKRSVQAAAESVQKRALVLGRTEPRVFTITEDGVTRRFKITPKAPKTQAQQRRPRADVKEIR